MVRLQKFLAECGVASRREAEKFIADGRVKVDGVVSHIGDGVDPETALVTLDDKPVRVDDKVYILLNKPRGVITSARDTHDRKTVIDLVTGVRARVFPVGRLDMDVEGALLLTNDGELAYRLMHPKFQVEKVYLATVEGVVTPQTASQLEHGVQLDDGRTAPAKVTILGAGRNSTRIQLTLREGRKREVKRMCTQVGHRVRELRRVAIGNIGVEGLSPGKWRHLTPAELDGLRNLTGLA